MTTTDPDILADDLDDPLGEPLLLQAVRDGSTGAFGILYARYRSFALVVAQRSQSRPDPAMAEDVVEVAFIRVLTALRNGKGPSDALRAYLATTVRREVWRAERRLRRQSEVVDRWASDEERAAEPDRSPLPARSTDLGSHALLGEAFRGLSDRWRNVLWLTEVEGRKPAEVASLLGLSAGSASALAYRARNGLIAAYVATYGRSTSDPTCAALSSRLGKYVAAGAPATGFDDVVAHLDGCASCRDVARGVDVLGSVLASLAPFGLLTAGLWAKTAGVGAAGLAGTAAAAATAQALAGTTTGAASTGAVGVVVGVAAAVVAVVGAGAAWAGLSGAGSEAAPPRPPAAVAADASAGQPPVTGAPVPTTGARTDVPTDPGSEPTVLSETEDATTTSAAPTVPRRPPTPSPTTAPSTTATPSTEAPSTTAPTSVSTTTQVEVPVGDGQLTGRAVEPDQLLPWLDAPVPGVDVVAYDDAGDLAGTASTGGDGRWMLDGLLPGHYLVVAIVPAEYRPESGDDPWTSGDTWATILGSVDLAKDPIDLVDLRLAPR